MKNSTKNAFITGGDLQLNSSKSAGSVLTIYLLLT